MPSFDTLRRLRLQIAALLRGRRLDADVDREMRFHVDMETAMHVRDGIAPDEARRRALVAFGGRERFREEVRDELHSRALEDLGQDLRHAVRTFRRTPAFTLTVLLTLAIGIGATTTIFSVTDHVVLRSLPYENAYRLMTVEVVGGPRNVTSTWPPNAAHFLAWKAGCTVCDGVAAVRLTEFTLTGVGDPTVFSGLRVSDDFFRELGARAELGRLLGPGDDQPDNRVIVMSDALWRQQFGARHDIIGHTITLNDAPWTVIGVVSPDFHVPVRHELGSYLKLPAHSDLFVPLALLPYQRTTQGEHDYGVLALAKPGIRPEALRAQLAAISTANATALHDDSANDLVVKQLHDTVVGGARRPLVLLLAAVGAVLLIMCVNLANLFLARGAVRRRESAVRVALGAVRARLVRQALTETVALAVVGGAFGVLLSRWGVRALVAAAPADLPRLDEVHVDARVLVVALLVSVLAGLAFGIGPALRFGRTAPGDVLKESARSATDGRSQARLRSSLIASQVGLSALLLVVAGLFLKSFERVVHAQRGFTEERVLAVNVVLPRGAFSTTASANQFYEDAMRRVGSLPGVTGTAVTNGVPLEGEAWIDGIRREGASKDDGGRNANLRFVSASYFDVLGVRLLAGRVFGDADRGTKRVVISENAARAMWPGETAVGKHLLVGSDTASEVIGVAQDVRTTDLEHDASLTVYIPYWEKGYAPTLLVRTALDPATISGSVRATLRDIAPSAPITRMRTMGEIVSRVTAQRRFEAVLIGLFAATALLTATIGIYGVISHSLTRRANEISVRIALGAEPRDVHGLVLREVLTPVAIGLAVGVVAAVGTGRAVSSLLFEVQPTDGATIGGVTVLLLAVAALACWVPARRATRLDPVEALRAS